MKPFRAFICFGAFAAGAMVMRAEERSAAPSASGDLLQLVRCWVEPPIEIAKTRVLPRKGATPEISRALIFDEPLPPGSMTGTVQHVGDQIAGADADVAKAAWRAAKPEQASGSLTIWDNDRAAHHAERLARDENFQPVGEAFTLRIRGHDVTARVLERKTYPAAQLVEVTVRVRVGFTDPHLQPRQIGTSGRMVYPVAMGAERISFAVTTQPADVKRSELDAAAVAELGNEVFGQERELIQFFNDPERWMISLQLLLRAAAGNELAKPMRFQSLETTFHVGPTERRPEAPDSENWGDDPPR